MIKKIKWFLFYRRVIRENRSLLYSRHSIRIDWVNRMYKTYILSPDDIEDVKSLGVPYIDKLLEKDRASIESTLIDLKIHQFVGLMEIEPLTSDRIGIAFRYKYFNTAKIAKKIIWILLSMLSIVLSSLINFTFLSIFIGLISILVIYLISKLLFIDRVTK